MDYTDTNHRRNLRIFESLLLVEASIEIPFSLLQRNKLYDSESEIIPRLCASIEVAKEIWYRPSLIIDQSIAYTEVLMCSLSTTTDCGSGGT
ncbi:UNVERIFIED_CONTAM: hypothetical protein NCL1_49283 [Trichonephila clavipes]